MPVGLLAYHTVGVWCCRFLHAVMLSVVATIFKRREQRATAWLSHAIHNFRDSTEAGDLRNTLDIYLRRLENACHLCSATCSHCRLPCHEISTHCEHSCGTDHKCQEFCQFCIVEDCQHRPCKEKAGHIGRHMCADGSHACGDPCALAGKALNCGRTCRKLPGHEGACDCQSGNHLCGTACDLPGCGGKCVAPYGATHDCHACENTHCPEVRTTPNFSVKFVLFSKSMFSGSMRLNAMPIQSIPCLDVLLLSIALVHQRVTYL